MDHLLQGKRAAITGAASGIGAEVSRQLARRGAEVHLIDRDQGALLQLLGEMRHAGQEAAVHPLDVTDAERVPAVFGAIAENGLDILINSAGICLPGGVERQDEAQWERTIAVNLTATWRCTKYAVPGMRRRGGGSIVNVGSNASLVGIPDAVAYVASKGGVAQLTKAMALDLAKDGIRVNCVCPGHTNTAMGERFIRAQADPERFREEWAAAHPLGRVAEPWEVASLIVFLASPCASFMTGAVMPIDGGYSAR